MKESHRERNRLVKEDNKHKSIIHGQIDQLFPGFLSQAKSGIQPFSKACIELMLCKNFGPQIFLKASSKTTYKLIKKAAFKEPGKVQHKLEPEVIDMRGQRLQKQLKNALMTIVRVAKENQHRAYRNTGITHHLKAHFDKVSLRGGASYTSTAKKLVRMMPAILRDETIYLPDIKQTQPEAYRQWIEDGTDKMLEKSRKAGISPTAENYLGKWFENKAQITALIDKYFLSRILNSLLVKLRVK